jgi:mannose-6-phosphate isomerase
MTKKPIFDKSTFTTEPYVAKHVEKPWGYEIHFVPENVPYMGKLIHIDKGRRLSLHVHDKRQETYWLLNGECNVILENTKGELETIAMKKGVSYSTAIGQIHRHEAITDCELIEASSPEGGTTWRVEDDYSRPNETPAQRKKERGEI